MSDDSPPLDDVVAGWWEYQRLSQGGRAERKSLEAGEPARAVAAADWVVECVEQGGMDAVALVKALVDGAATDDDLGLVGAGPLEDLLVAHGVELAKPIAETARREPRFAAALGTVWWSPPDRDVAQQLGRWLDAPESGTQGDRRHRRG